MKVKNDKILVTITAIKNTGFYHVLKGLFTRSILKRRIYQIGFNKCGSTSLHYFFVKNGINSIHLDNGNIARTIIKNHKIGRKLLKGYRNFTAFTDMEGVLGIDSTRYTEEDYLRLRKKSKGPLVRRVSEEFFKQMYYEDPDAVFILNIRPLEDWIKSRIINNNGNYWKWYRDDIGTPRERVVKYWKKEYEEHIKNVNNFFKDKGNLLIFDISKDTGEELSKYLNKFGFDCDPKKWEKCNETAPTN